MKIKLEYVLPLQDMAVFSHLPGNRLPVIVDTNALDEPDDLIDAITSEIQRTYSVCITKFHPEAVPNWPRIQLRVKRVIYERAWNDAMARATNFNELYEKTMASMKECVHMAYEEANEKRRLWEAAAEEDESYEA